MEDIRTLLRDLLQVRYLSISRGDRGPFRSGSRTPAARDAGQKAVGKELRRSSSCRSDEKGGEFLLTAALPPAEQKQIKDLALQQNITTLRNRVNALGVAEPNIARQGERRIVGAGLPGAPDPGRPRDILGATATLEYRLVDTEHSVVDAEAGRVPVGSRLYRDREGQPVLLKRRVIVTGDQVAADASSGVRPAERHAHGLGESGRNRRPAYARYDARETWASLWPWSSSRTAPWPQTGGRRTR